MPSVKRIAFAKIGWGEDYQGEAIRGRHGWISENNDAHERYNFLPGPDGRFYGYLPPIGKKLVVPQPARRDGWLVIFVAPDNGNGKLRPVGWFEDARFVETWAERPEYESGASFPKDIKGGPYYYAIESPRATLLDLESRRQFVVPGRPHFGSTPILYAAGSGKPGAWRQEYVELAKRITGTRVPPGGTGSGFPDAARRREIEQRGIEAVIAHLTSKHFKITDRQSDNCGYDLLAAKKDKEWHIEVKATSGSSPHFYMSRNEHNYTNDPRWRLAMVTDALGEARVQIFDAAKFEKAFDMKPFQWEGVWKS